MFNDSLEVRGIFVDIMFQIHLEHKESIARICEPYKGKINGVIKGRTCANGSKQKEYLKRYEVFHHHQYC